MGCKKQGAKNRVNVIKKEKRLGCLFFAAHILNLFVQGHKPTHVFKTRILGADCLGDCWAVGTGTVFRHRLPCHLARIKEKQD